MSDIRMEIRWAIADAINDQNRYSPNIDSKHVEEVEFRKGCSEIDVSYSIPDYDYKGYATIDAAPVPALVQALIDKEE